MRLFGPVDDEFFAAVGRVVMVAALVDDMLLRLLWALTSEVQEKHAGEHGHQLESRCRTAAARYSKKLCLDVVAVVDDVAKTRVDRNSVVHSMWPDPSLDKAFGWRAVVAKRNGGQATTSYEPTRATFAELVTNLVAQVSKIEALLPRAETEKAALTRT